MEAIGLQDFPYLVIRGICNYADSYKYKIGQEYTAATVACGGVCKGGSTFSNTARLGLAAREDHPTVSLW